MFLLKDKKPPVNKLLDVVLMVKLGKTDILISLIILLQLIRIANFTNVALSRILYSPFA